MTPEVFGTLASITAIVVYIVYFRQIQRGDSVPNPATWAIWVLVSLINAVTYYEVVSDNVWKSLIAIVTPSLMIMVFFYALFRGKFAKVGRIEMIAFIMVIIIGVFWQTTKNDRVTNLLLQTIYIISFIPTVTGLIGRTLREHPTSWIIAVIAYTFAVCAVAVDFHGDWLEFAYPVVNGIIGNGSVAVLAIIQNRKSLKN